MSPVSCWILLLLCHSRHGRRPGPQKTTTQQHNKRAASLGWGFAPLATTPSGVSCCGSCCCYATAGTAEGRAHKRQQHCSTTKELLLWGGASLRSPMRLTGCCCRATRTPDQQIHRRRRCSAVRAPAARAAKRPQVVRLVGVRSQQQRGRKR